MTLHLENVGYRYGRDNVLRSVTADVQSGHVTALVGPNAAGKSTLLRCAMGSLRPQQGFVRINDIDVHRTRPIHLARLLAYVAQRPSVASAFTVREVVELGRYALPVDRDRIAQAMHDVAISEHADRPFHELSVGQQQRVMVARAIGQIESGGHLLLDEPVSAMDYRHVRLVMNVLNRQARNGACVLIALHDLAMALSYADDVLVLNDGQVAAFGPVKAIVQSGMLQRVFDVAIEMMTSKSGRDVPVIQHDATRMPKMRS